MDVLSDDSLRSKLAVQQACLAQLRSEYVLLGQQIAAQGSEIAATEVELRRRELTAAQAAANNLDWPHLLLEGQGMLHHRLRNRELKALGLSSQGFHPDTLQRCVCICMHPAQAGEVDELAASLVVVMPHVMPLPDGWCAINILENSQSGANYQLRFRPDLSEFQVANMRMRSPDIEITSADLREVLAHIQLHHYMFEPTLEVACS